MIVAPYPHTKTSYPPTHAMESRPESWARIAERVTAFLSGSSFATHDIISALDIPADQLAGITPDILKKHYRKLMGVLHPDRCNNNAAASNAYVLLNASRDDMFKTDDPRTITDLIRSKVELFQRNKPVVSCFVPQVVAAPLPLYTFQLFKGCSMNPRVGHGRFGGMSQTTNPFVRIVPQTRQPPPMAPIVVPKPASQPRPVPSTPRTTQPPPLQHAPFRSQPTGVNSRLASTFHGVNKRKPKTRPTGVFSVWN